MVTQRRGDRKRWVLIDALRVVDGKPISIRALAAGTGISPDMVQHHLGILEAQGVIRVENKQARRSLPRAYHVLTVAENPDKEQSDGE